MGNEEKLKIALARAAKKEGIEVEAKDIVIERSRDVAHGDYSTNIALRYAKSLGKNPRDLASALQRNIEEEAIEKIEIAGPGFINFFMKKDALQNIVAKVLSEGENYGKLPSKNQKINLEYVSANPTGDLHLGHTRCAAVGDSLARLLTYDGYDVTREFYVNDCGNQIEHLGHSIRARYHELFGEPLDLGDDDYHGTDLIAIAQSIKDQYGDAYLEDNEKSHDFFIRFGIDAELAKLKKDLSDFGVTFDVFTYESDIRKGGTLDKVLGELKSHLYESEGATFLKTSDYLDDKDRPVIKSNGQPTYFLPDICYHYNKGARGFDHLIDVLGADHHGYVNRMKSALMMKGYAPDYLEVTFVQVVRVFRDGEEVKMSKRTGKAIAHRDLVEDVGVDAVRYFFTERNQSSHLDFNYNLATEQSSSNPVYYCQYAHARCCSLLALGEDIALDESAKMCQSAEEASILKHLADFASMIEGAARDRAPYKVAAYAHDLAEHFHEFYAKNRVIDRDNIPLTASRLALIKAVKIAMENALGILGVSAPTKM
ncbi:MAG: arginine--tRNA ligase [Bacilli bacterium]|nr:arginine--tRNA ligase [Bacilli bacterium]